jgi:hypothetical protein
LEHARNFPFNQCVLREGGFEVELSNEGAFEMENPCDANPTRRRDFPCRAQGCRSTTKTKDGLCKAHRGKVDHPHLVDWIGRIYPPGIDREKCKNFAPEHAALLELLVLWMKEPPEGSKDRESREKKMDDFVDDALSTFVGQVPDATSMQEDWESTDSKKGELARNVIKDVNDLVNRHFPEATCNRTILPGKTFRKQAPQDAASPKGDGQQLLTPSTGGGRAADGAKKKRSFYDIPVEKVPIRVVAALTLVGLACEESNRGDLWFVNKYKGGKGSTRASIYMPIAYYLLRRHTRALDKQARMSLRTRVRD